MSRLLIFNPEHDYALSQREGFSNFRKGIKALSEKLQFLPVIWAKPDDYILTYDNQTVCGQKIDSPFSFDEIKSKITEIYPWGWDCCLTNRLKAIGIPDSFLPSQTKLQEIKKLSHRRTTVDLNRYLQTPDIPIEFFKVEEAMNFYHLHPDCYFKAPWSSSGRGVIACEMISDSRINEWLIGIIRQQGSVMGEVKADKKMEFASLWTCKDGETVFRGVSVTLSYPNGSYQGNLCGSQVKLRSLVEKDSRQNIEDVFQLQKAFLKDRIAPYYSGRLGIDMFLCDDGSVRAGVEINLRNTMGHAAIDYFEKLQATNNGKWIPDPYKLLIEA